ncbi:DegT/DnrJ/EryC1/StrS family aminotransferase [Terasakiella pusilla]|uniref:DegT/DnrJ/EryC1/StrS family aminotransferase n=1 Tax=Terasakiella pusilla TaxID=64973 RepID=UPI003AA8B127
MTPSIPFIDLKAQSNQIRDKINSRITQVIDHGGFILGPEVQELEDRLAAYSGAKYAISCANGTDALQLILMAEGIGSGDVVFVPAMTFVATVEVVPLLGATPFFVDVLPDTFNIDPKSLEQAIVDAKAQGLKPRAVIAVDLFGQPADYVAVNQLAQENGLVVIADAAQSFGGSSNGEKTGRLAQWTSTSFFPAKPLGCYGDGGAIFTDDAAQAELIKSLRVHGKGSHKYENVRIGINSRLDTLQAAILIEKLAIFESELQVRQEIAGYYSERLQEYVDVPFVKENNMSAWAQYTLLCREREQLQERLKEKGIPTVCYYPIALHEQKGYLSYPCVSSGLKVSQMLAKQVISLPMHPYLDRKVQDYIIDTVIDSL